MVRTALMLIGGLAATMGGRGDGAEGPSAVEDDLTVVRRAVSQAPATVTRAPDTEEKGRKAPRWLRVRVIERGKAKVSVNVPLALARALGDDIPLDWGCRRRCEDGRRTIRLGDVLRSLDAGQDIVQVDSEDATVRVWVE